jgi:nucleoside-diphosphate-sugar epimerase
MKRNILILGASYGSLLATKLVMAGHNVTLVCRSKTAELINRDVLKFASSCVTSPLTGRSCLAIYLGPWTQPHPQMSTFRVTTSLALLCRSRNIPTTQSGF